MDQDTTWYEGLGPRHIVLDGDPTLRQFSAYVCCGQMAGWIKIKIKMPRGMDLGVIMRFYVGYCKAKNGCHGNVP